MHMGGEWLAIICELVTIVLWFTCEQVTIVFVMYVGATYYVCDVWKAS